MRKLIALLLSLTLSVVLFLMYTTTSTQLEEVTIQRVIDGDTFVLEDGRTVRMLNINAPESGTFAAETATTYLKEYKGRQVTLEITGVEKYGRYLGRVYGPEYLNQVLVEKGLASIFLVDQDELTLFYQSQKQAVSAGKGMWEHSKDYGCLEAHLDPEKEVVKFTSRCSRSLKGWTIKDESTKTYILPSEVESEFSLYSGEGTSTSKDLFWNEGNVWNNDRDSLIVRDSKGGLVYYESYGY